MRREAIESFDHKGLKVSIYQDEDYNESPNDNGDDSLFLVGFHRDFSVERDGFSKDFCRYLVDGDYETEYKEEAKEVRKKYHVIGLEAYIHSGVVLALSQEGNFPDRRWDVSQLGLVFIEKKVWKTKAKAREAALSLVKEWNYHLSGEVYGYTVTRDITCKTCGNTEEESIDSCWGFVGDMKYCKEQAIEAAEAELAPKVPANQAPLGL